MNELENIKAKYQGLYQDYELKEAKLRARINTLEDQLEHTKKRQDSLVFPSWHNNLLTPIVEELAKHIPCDHYKIGGPFGLSHESPVFFYAQADEGGDYKYIYFLPGNLSKGEVLIRDYSIDRGNFRKGTIGQMNGMNHPSIELPPDIKGILQYVLSSQRQP